MIEEYATKFIRLITGEDLIANCFINEKTQCVDIENPMKVVITRSTSSGKTILVMMPWLPLEIVSDEFATLKLEDVLTIVEPKESFLEYYKNTIEEYSLLNEEDEGDLSLDKMMDDELDMFDDDEIKEALNTLKGNKKNLLH